MGCNPPTSDLSKRYAPWGGAGTRCEPGFPMWKRVGRHGGGTPNRDSLFSWIQYLEACSGLDVAASVSEWMSDHSLTLAATLQTDGLSNTGLVPGMFTAGRCQPGNAGREDFCSPVRRLPCGCRRCPFTEPCIIERRFPGRAGPLGPPRFTTGHRATDGPAVRPYLSPYYARLSKAE